MVPGSRAGENMSAFNFEHIHQRVAEPGVTNLLTSVADEIWTLTSERMGPGMLSPFVQQATSNTVTATGYEHRGDLSKSYSLSLEQAPEAIIAIRYALEIAGYEKAKQLFFNLPPYSTVLLFSPPPEDTGGRFRELGYASHSMAYFYHILPGENENTRTIKSLTCMHRLSMEEQAQILNNLYGEDVVKPTERSVLLNPMGISVLTEDTASFKLLWSEIEKVYNAKHRDFILPPLKLAEEMLLNGRELQKSRDKVLALMIDELAQEIAMGKSEHEIRTRWNIMLNLADSRRLSQDFSTNKKETTSLEPLSIYQAQAIFMHYQHLDYEPKQIATACGLSGSSSTGPNLRDTLFGTKEYTVQSSQLSSKENSKNTLHCTCPTCKNIVDAKINNGKIHCPECGASAEYHC